MTTVSYTRNNPYCTPQTVNFPRWGMRDVWIRHVMKDDETNYTGEPYLLLYKDAYIKYYRQQILITAFEEKNTCHLACWCGLV